MRAIVASKMHAIKINHLCQTLDGGIMKLKLQAQDPKKEPDKDPNKDPSKDPHRDPNKPQPDPERIPKRDPVEPPQRDPDIGPISCQ